MQFVQLSAPKGAIYVRPDHVSIIGPAMSLQDSRHPNTQIRNIYAEGFFHTIDDTPDNMMLLLEAKP